MRGMALLFNRTVVGLAVVASASLAAGCSSDDEPSASSACAAYASAWVGFDARCGYNSLSGSLKDEIVQTRADYCVRALSMKGTSVNASRVQACADWLQGRSCEGTSSTSPCDLDDPGTLPDGERCFDETQCASGYCYRDTSNMADYGDYAFSCGVCMPRTPLGVACDYDTPCEEGAYCGNANICVLPPGVGQSCEESYVCAGDASCDYGSGLCVAPVANGSACTSQSMCAYGSTCVDGVCDPGRGLGEECDFGCAGALTCIEGRCAKPTYVPPGSVCDEDTYCQVGSCSSYYEPGVCPTLLADGAPCNDSASNAQCNYGSVCRGQVCTPINPGMCN